MEIPWLLFLWTMLFGAVLSYDGKFHLQVYFPSSSLSSRPAIRKAMKRVAVLLFWQAEFKQRIHLQMRVIHGVIFKFYWGGLKEDEAK